MQADLRRLPLLCLFLILTLVPPAALHAQIATPTPRPTAEQVQVQSETSGDVEPDSATPNSAILLDEATGLPDEEAIRSTVDALIDAQVDYLIGQMGVEDKVGQIFLVHFSGNDTDILSDIAVLIHAYRISGVVLSPSHHNFTNQRGVDTPAEVASLTNRLQALAYGHLLPNAISLVDEADIQQLVENLPSLADKEAEADRPAMNIPLFVGIEQLGDELDVTSLRRDFTELPNQMALGAAWTPELAQAVGRVVGQELTAVGVSLLLGPSLDMLIQPRPDSVGRLGIHMYGGNPYWVSEMGQSYITGIHEGSNRQLLTVVRHFPGQGDVDRLPDQEVATIQGDIEELRYGALAPFKAVTDGEAGNPGNTDMMMPSHMRFSSIQGPGPERIPPLGLSSDLTNLLTEEGFDPWLESGLIVSDALGTPAIRRYYETDDGGFPARQVAQDAFAAGNDILYLGHFADDEEWETERVNIESTISFFQERYENDYDFADQVDAAVRRILQTKLRLYADMDALEQEALSLLTEADSESTETTTTGTAQLSTPLATPTATPELPNNTSSEPGFDSPIKPVIPLERLLVFNEQLAILDEESDHQTEANALVRQVARDSLTVLFPDISVPSESLPQPPKADDKIVIFTDSRLQQECSDCTVEVAIGPDDIENIILRLYGPDATDQITEEQITSLTFSELVDVLDSSAAVEEEAEPGSTPPVLLPTPTAETPAASEVESGDPDSERGETTEPIDRTMQIERDIDTADWLIFAMLDVDPAIYPSDAVKRFLRERGDQLEGKKIVVLALQAPYFLDATEISALSSYLGVYSKSSSFLENAVRSVFHSYTPNGSPPVSVSGTRFANLEERLQPDPLLVIDLQIVAEDVELPTIDGGNSPDAQLAVPAGTTIRVQVGPVFDRNGQPVPDNTLVEYQLIYDGEELALNVEPANTHNGMALRDILLDRAGSLQISATVGNAGTGEPYMLLVTETESESAADDGAAADGGDAPPSDSAVVTADPLETNPENGTEVDGTTNDGQTLSTPTTSEDRVDLATLFIALLILTVTISLLLIVQNRIVPRTNLVHNLLWTAIAGLAAYIMYGVGLLPGANWLHGYFGVIAAGLVVLVSMIVTLLWLQLRSN
jgi:beta-glucosidase-like glycosyl hydrolase